MAHSMDVSEKYGLKVVEGESLNSQIMNGREYIPRIFKCEDGEIVVVIRVKNYSKVKDIYHKFATNELEEEMNGYPSNWIKEFKYYINKWTSI